MSHRDWEFLTVSGRWVDLLEFTEDDVAIVDIAHHLSMTNRFGGACVHSYNNAQHSVLVADLAKYALSDAPDSHSEALTEASRVRRMHELRALLHDAAETYLGDITRPVKEALRRVQYLATGVSSKTSFDVLHDEIQYIIEGCFGIDPWRLSDFGRRIASPSIIDHCDRLALAIEDAVLRRHTGMTVDKATEQAETLSFATPTFLRRYRELADDVADVQDPNRARDLFLDRFNSLYPLPVEAAS